MLLCVNFQIPTIHVPVGPDFKKLNASKCIPMTSPNKKIHFFHNIMQFLNFEWDFCLGLKTLLLDCLDLREDIDSVSSIPLELLVLCRFEFRLRLEFLEPVVDSLGTGDGRLSTILLVRLLFCFFKLVSLFLLSVLTEDESASDFPSFTEF